MADQPVYHTQSAISNHGFDALEPDSHTAQRLKHASAEHLHLTSRRFFIGPIPEGWLNSHRKSWYRRKLEGISNYSSKTASFSASQSSAYQRQLTGLEGPSSVALFGHSTRQQELEHEPTIVEEEELEEEGGEEDDNVPTQELEPVNTAELDVPQIVGIEDAEDPPRSKSIPVPSENGLDRSRENGRQEYGSLGHGKNTKSPGQETFVTAHESVRSQPQFEGPADRPADGPTDGPADGPSTNNLEPNNLDPRPSTSLEQQRKDDLSPSNGRLSPFPETASSTTSLLPHRDPDTKSKKSHHSQKPLLHRDPAPITDEQPQTNGGRKVQRVSTGVRFSDNLANTKDRAKGKVSRAQQRAAANLRRNTLREGAVVKMEKMLVRIDFTLQDVPQEFDENDGQKIETQLVEKWREYMIVVRQNHKDDSDFRLQIYNSRVIPAVESGNVRKKCHHEIYLNPKNTRVNLYSSLDKTVVIWHPYRKGTRMYIMRPRAEAHAVEWYTFLRDVLGWSRPSVLVVNVPDLSVTLRLDNPFQELEATRDTVQGAENDDAWKKTMDEEKAVASRIIQRCLDMLEGDPEWASVLDRWSKAEKMGLAWKRYDRLEWIHGVNEQKMYGSMAMQRTHELELRPKQHYPTSAMGKKGKIHEEPAPLEGFLVRLTSQKGIHKRLGKMFFKRLYFATQDQFLLFSRPSRVSPPHPPKLVVDGSHIPSAAEIAAQVPLVYDIDPYPLEDGQIRWLKSGNKAYVSRHDQEAYEEQRRAIDNLTNCDGYINMCRIVKVRNFKWGATSVDDELEEGSDVDFHQDVRDTRREDGATDKVDDDRIFEIVLDNGLVIRLQAYNEETRNEWVKRLRRLVKYWKLRTNEDMGLFKMIRQTNLELLRIDEEMEAIIGQFARKWEVSKTQASPNLFHMCGIGCCRPITISGTLYRKPRRHATFLRCGVILTDGKLLSFQGSLRKRSGKEIPHIHQDVQQTLDLKDCYIYSGLITDDDLLYQNQTFDSNHPGLHALPRIYLGDSWTSRDQDTMTCFVLWHSLRKSYFKANEEKDGRTRQKLRQVSRLGVPGRSIVFKCRSRAERDHWVMNIGMEIDRLQQGEDVRIQLQD